MAGSAPTPTPHPSIPLTSNSDFFFSDYPLIYCILASFSLEILWASDQDTKTKIVLFPSVQQGGGVRGNSPHVDNSLIGSPRHGEGIQLAQRGGHLRGDPIVPGVPHVFINMQEKPETRGQEATS